VACFQQLFLSTLEIYDAPNPVYHGGGLFSGRQTTHPGAARPHYQKRGLKRRGRDQHQASDLVDTNTLSFSGFEVGEWPVLFCCNFDGLMQTIETLGADRRPDVILAERWQLHRSGGHRRARR